MSKPMITPRNARTPRGTSRAKSDEGGEKQLPFWQDLNHVTQPVAPWSVFSILMDTPEVPLKLSVPTTFMFVPNEKLVARVSTGMDGKLCIRNDTKQTPVTFEMMETNLVDCFNSRITDRQPYICTVYSSTDYKPCFVTKSNFTLFTLYLRASLGQNISSYGREEQELAIAIFPENVACVQAYVPLEFDKRFISIYLQSPHRTLIEVHALPFYENARINDYIDEAAIANSTNSLLTLIPAEDPASRHITKRTTAVILCLRKYHGLHIPGFVSEFVQGVDGNLYMTMALRVSNPQVRHFPTVIRDKSRLNMERSKGRQTFNQVAAAVKPHMIAVMPKSSSLTSSLATVFAVKNAANVMKRKLSLKTGNEALMPGASFRLSPRAQRSMALEAMPDKPTEEEEEEEAMRLRQLALKTAEDTPAEMLHEAERLHALGRFHESVTILDKAEMRAAAAAAARHQASNSRGKSLGGASGTCFRCGEYVFADGDKPGAAISHHDWRQKAKELDAAQRGEEVAKGVKKGKSGLENVLLKMERLAKGQAEDGLDDEEAPKVRTQSLCYYCLSELGKDIRNQQFARGIQMMRAAKGLDMGDSY